LASYLRARRKAKKCKEQEKITRRNKAEKKQKQKEKVVNKKDGGKSKKKLVDFLQPLQHLDRYYAQAKYSR